MNILKPFRILKIKSEPLLINNSASSSESAILKEENLSLKAKVNDLQTSLDNRMVTSSDGEIQARIISYEATISDLQSTHIKM